MIKYSILVAKIKTETVPTYSLFHPAEEKQFYEDSFEIKDFDSQVDAFNFVQQYLPLTEYICIPGFNKGLQLYWDLWGGAEEEVLQDIQLLSMKLHSLENYNFDYMHDDYDDLKIAMDEYEKIENPPTLEEREQGTDFIIDGYTFDKSRLIGDKFDFMMGRCFDLDFKDLTLEEKKQCILYNSKNVWVNQGYVFDLYCKKQHPDHPVLFAYYLYATHQIERIKYKIENSITQFYHDTIYKINKFRIKKGWF